MDSDAPPQQFLDNIDRKRFPDKLWSLVNDPANNSICWDSRGEAVIINQGLFEKEVLSKGCGLPDTFRSFHRQLNLYGFKRTMSVRGKGINMGCKHFANPNFKRGYPGLVHQLTRNTVKNRLKAVAQNTHQLLQENEKSLVDHRVALPPHGFQPGKEMLVYSQQHFSPMFYYQPTHYLNQSGLEESTFVPTQRENLQWQNDDINSVFMLQNADELMSLPSSSNVQSVSLVTNS